MFSLRFSLRAEIIEAFLSLSGVGKGFADNQIVGIAGFFRLVLALKEIAKIKQDFGHPKAPFRAEGLGFAIVGEHAGDKADPNFARGIRIATTG